MNESSFTGTPSRQVSVKRIGYHRLDDDSVSSAVLNEVELHARLNDIFGVSAVDQIWTRDERDEVDFEWRRVNTNDSDFKIRTSDGRWATFAYLGFNKSVYLRNTGATFNQYNNFGKPRWTTEKEAVSWAMAYVKLDLV